MENDSGPERSPLLHFTAKTKLSLPCLTRFKARTGSRARWRLTKDYGATGSNSRVAYTHGAERSDAHAAVGDHATHETFIEAPTGMYHIVSELRWGAHLAGSEIIFPAIFWCEES